MIEVHVISTPEFDLKKFLTLSNKLIGRSLTTNIDRYRIEPGGFSFISGLLEMVRPGSSPLHEIPDYLLEHLFYTFACLMPWSAYYKIMEKTHLCLVGGPSIVEDVCYKIISANMLTWRNAVVTLSNEDDYTLRVFAKKMYQEFDKLKMSNVFISFERFQNADGTFKLLTY